MGPADVWPVQGSSLLVLAPASRGFSSTTLGCSVESADVSRLPVGRALGINHGILGAAHGQNRVDQALR